MIKFFKHKKLGISAKTSFINGAVVLIFLSIVGIIIMKFESNVVDFIISYHMTKSENILNSQSDIQKKSLEKRMAVNAEIASSFVGIFVYDWNLKGLEIALTPYMKLPEIEAIIVLETGDKPFFAIWKTPDIKTGKIIPESVKLNHDLFAQSDCQYEGMKTASIQIYYTDGKLAAAILKSKAEVKTEVTGFKEIINKKLQDVFLKQAAAILFAVLILIITINICLRIIAIKPLRGMINTLNQIAGDLTLASNGILSASQLLAENASDLAAHSEESSSSLKKITEMSRETSTLTAGAEELMNANIEKSGQSLKSLVALTRKMEDIEKTNDQISQTIKNISEIAFQTNLLSLNAAIEAARGGEAGAGFSVVADEVRNLAARTSDASRKTHELLENTMAEISGSAQLTHEISKSFELIIESATIMGEKTADITNANKDQTSKISLINTAGDKTKNVSQQLAARAQESVAEAHELAALADMMKQSANQLKAMVGFSGK